MGDKQMKLRGLLVAALLYALPEASLAQNQLPAVPGPGGVPQTSSPVVGVGYDTSTGLPCVVAPTRPTCSPTSVTVVSVADKGGTLTSGGAAQNAIALNTSRKGWCVQNDPAATEVLTVRTDGTASATTGTILNPGQQVCNPPGLVSTGAISVFAATTSHRWFGQEFQ